MMEILFIFVGDHYLKVPHGPISSLFTIESNPFRHVNHHYHHHHKEIKKIKPFKKKRF
jgi:hypothetical protein